MTFVLALLAAIVGFALGAALGTAIGSVLAPILGISSFEGASGYFAVFIGGGLGGLIGLVAGAVWMLRRRGVQGFGAIAGRFGLVVVGIAALTAGVIGFFYLTQDIVNPNGLAPRLVFEIRLPAGAAPPKGTEVQLNTSKNQMPALMQPDAMRTEGDRTILVGSVEMYFRVSSRLLAMTLPDKTDVIFDIKLPGKPKHARELGDWQRATYIADPGQAQPRRTTPNDNYDIRYRTEWAGEE